MKFNLLFSLLSSTQIELFCEFKLALTESKLRKPEIPKFYKISILFVLYQRIFDFQPNFTSNSLNCAEILADRCKYGAKQII